MGKRKGVSRKGGAGAGLLPKPYTPASDPPTLRNRGPRQYRFRLDPVGDISSSGVYDFSGSDILHNLVTHNGISVSHIQLCAVEAWTPIAPPGDQASFFIELVCNHSGIKVSDFSTGVTSGRAALAWPPAARTIYTADDTGDPKPLKVTCNHGGDGAWEGLVIEAICMAW